MAITEDMEFPRLTPPEDRLQSYSRLFRRPEELTDDQFDLLAAAWAEDALAGDALAELESVISSDTGKKERAESFRRLHLVPGPDKWPGRKSALKSSPAKTALRRTIIPALLAAAAMMFFIINGPAGAKLKNVNTETRTTVNKPLAAAEIPESLPIITAAKPVATARKTIKASPEAGKTLPLAPVVPAESRDAETYRANPLVTGHENAVIPAIIPETGSILATLRMADINPVTAPQAEKNWMVRGISFLASAVTGKEKQIDGYAIASGCINGLNTILGWNMELDKVSDGAGEPVAVNFSSTLLSFTKPVNKSTP